MLHQFAFLLPSLECKVIVPDPCTWRTTPCQSTCSASTDGRLPTKSSFLHRLKGLSSWPNVGFAAKHLQHQVLFLVFTAFLHFDFILPRLDCKIIVADPSIVRTTPCLSTCSASAVGRLPSKSSFLHRLIRFLSTLNVGFAAKCSHH